MTVNNTVCNRICYRTKIMMIKYLLMSRCVDLYLYFLVRRYSQFHPLLDINHSRILGVTVSVFGTYFSLCDEVYYFILFLRSRVKSGETTITTTKTTRPW